MNRPHVFLVQLHVPPRNSEEKELLFRRECEFTAPDGDDYFIIGPKVDDAFVLASMRTDMVGIPGSCPVYGKVTGRLQLPSGRLLLLARVSPDPERLNGKSNRPRFEMRIGDGSYDAGLDVIRQSGWEQV